MQSVHFSLAYWCLLLAALIPYICAGVAKFGGVPAEGGAYDNDLPRAWLAKQTGWRARANSAQANAFESLPFFMAAVIVAHQLGANQGRLDILAFFYVLLRVAYSMAYIAGVDKIRSAIWVAGLFINVAILFIGYR
jgi:uncharacterized MAPEG superfamily protein